MARQPGKQTADRSMVPSPQHLKIRTMTASHRKLIGTFLMLGFLAVYAVIALAIAAILQVHGGRVVEWVFYVVAGLAWVPGAAWIVSWMHRSEATPAKPE